MQFTQLWPIEPKNIPYDVFCVVSFATCHWHFDLIAVITYIQR